MDAETASGGEKLVQDTQASPERINYQSAFIYRGQQLKEGYVFEFRNGDQLIRPDVDEIFKELNTRLEPRGVKLVLGKYRVRRVKGVESHHKWRELTCDAYGKSKSRYVKIPVEDGGRPNTKSKKIGCPVRIVLVRDVRNSGDIGPWTVDSLCDEHNHPCAKPWRAKPARAPEELCACGRPFLTAPSNGAVKRKATEKLPAEPAGKTARQQPSAGTDLAVLERAATTLVGLKKNRYISGDDFDLALDSAERDPTFARKIVAISDPDERLGYILRQVRKQREQGGRGQMHVRS